MTSTTFSEQILQTSGSSVTAWLPLSTPWPATTQCSSLVYIGSGKDAGKAFGWDPLYGKVLDTGSPQCLPLEVWSWWFETADIATPTLLGPTFRCPQAYTTASTAVQATGVTEIFCCPSQYDFATPIPFHNPGADYPSQCMSTITSGGTLYYQTPTGGIYQPTSMKISDTFLVHGQHVNGFNIDAKVFSSMTAAPSISTPISTSTSNQSPSNSQPSTVISSSSSKPLPENSNNSKSKSSTALAAGVGVAAAILIIALVAGAIFFFLRRKNQRRASENSDLIEPPEYSGSDVGDMGMKQELYGSSREIGLGNTRPGGIGMARELHGDHMLGELEA